jgi:hypothetical protein
MKNILAVAALSAALFPATASAREVEGSVVAVNRDARTFSLRDEGRTVRVKVNSSTRYHRLSGFGAIRVGMTRVEAIVRRANGRWVATLVERSGGGGGGGGDDD